MSAIKVPTDGKMQKGWSSESVCTSQPSEWVNECVWDCCPLSRGEAPPTASTVPFPLPPDIGSASTLLNQSGNFNCACCWVSFTSAHSTHVQSRRHSSTGDTLTSTLMEYYCFLLLLCCQQMGELKVFMSYVILGFFCVCVFVCQCVYMCTCGYVCVCRCACWPWSIFIQHCSVGIL